VEDDGKLARQANARRLQMTLIQQTRPEMTRNPVPPARIVVPLILAFALFIGAIIARDFWLSLGLGLGGALTFAYAVIVLREARKRLREEKAKT